jgi:hypothetical protein
LKPSCAVVFTIVNFFLLQVSPLLSITRDSTLKEREKGMFKGIKATLTAATAIALSGTAATAGGLADEIVEAPVVVEDPVEVAPAAGSIPSWVIPVAVVALFVGLASRDSGDSGGESESEPDEKDGPPLKEF